MAMAGTRDHLSVICGKLETSIQFGDFPASQCLIARGYMGPIKSHSTRNLSHGFPMVDSHIVPHDLDVFGVSPRMEPTSRTDGHCDVRKTGLAVFEIAKRELRQLLNTWGFTWNSCWYPKSSTLMRIFHYKQHPTMGVSHLYDWPQYTCGYETSSDI